MIYESKKVSKIWMSPVNTTLSPFEYLCAYKPGHAKNINDQSSKEEIKYFKENSLPYFLAGRLRNNTRSNANLLEKELVTLDYDDLGSMSHEEFVAKVKKELRGTGFLIYPTIKNNLADYGLRYRLVIDTDRPYTEKENKMLIPNVIDYIGLPCDSASLTWSQPMFLPCLNANSSESLIMVQEGDALKVDDFLYTPLEIDQEEAREPKKVSGKEVPTRSEVLRLVQEWTNRVGDKLNDYSFFLNAYSVIKHDLDQGTIDQDTAFQCLTILAKGNSAWAENNIEKLKHDHGTINSPTTSTQFFSWSSDPEQDFEGMGEDGELLAGDALKGALIARHKSELEKARAEWLANGAKGKKPSALSPMTCSVILQKYVKFCLYDSNENSRLAMYQADKGLYTQNESLVRRLISWLEPTLNFGKASDVIYYLTNAAEIKEKTISRYLIPVENGVFNLKTKKLEPFTPDHVFTSKISTPYAEVKEPPILDGWALDAWLQEIACDDDEIVRLLWEVISDAINGSYSRKKAIFLVGQGSNGKGTFQALLENLIGKKNIATLKIEDFSKDFMLYHLIGKVVCIGDDSIASFVEDTSDFNSVVTGDTVLVEPKYKDPYAANFSLTVIESTNALPKIKNKTYGTYRRLLLVPFKAQFKEKKDNPDIKEIYMRDERVLQYVLYKAINMDFERFSIPKASREMLENFKQDNDPLVDFKTSIFDPLRVSKIPFYIVWEMYRNFCRENNFISLSKRKFSIQFKDLLGDKWESSDKKYSKEEVKRIEDHISSVILDPIENGKNYKSYYKSNLKLLA